MPEPTLDDLWEGKAEFRCEDPKWVAMTVNLDPNHVMSSGRLGLDRFKNGQIVGIYRHSKKGEPDLVKMALSDDGVNFHHHQTLATQSGWGGSCIDPALVIFEMQGVEHIFVFYEASRLNGHKDVVVNTGCMWSKDKGNTWEHNVLPLTDSKDIPDWGKTRFRGTSVPSPTVATDHMHLWVYWTGLYEENPNHAEVGAGYIGFVKPGTHNWLSLDSGGVLDRRSDGSLLFTIDQGQRDKPVLERGPDAWCKGAVDLNGNVTKGDDGRFYTVFRAGFYSEGHGDDFFSAGLARSIDNAGPFIKRSQLGGPYWGPVVMPPGPGVAYGISYPWLFKIDSSWYLYYVCDKERGPVPTPGAHFRLKLQWN